MLQGYTRKGARRQLHLAFHIFQIIFLRDKVFTPHPFADEHLTWYTPLGMIQEPVRSKNTVGTVLLAGFPVGPGICGETSGLSELATSDASKHTVSFQNLYATIQEQWLGVSLILALVATLLELALLR